VDAATFIPAIAEQLDRASARVEVADARADTVSAPALVFLPPLYGNYLQNPFSFLRNQPELHEGDIVYALSLSEESDAHIIESFSDRAVYRFELAGGWSDKPGFDPQIEISLVDSDD
jgi:hypothetical protein